MKKVLLIALCLASSLLAGTAAFADFCYAERNCGGGHTVQCSDTSGTSGCFVLGGGVDCPGSTGVINCPTVTTDCPAQLICPTTIYSYAWALSCGGATCSTNFINNSITCNGFTKTCDSCELSYNQGRPTCSSFW